MTVFFSSSISPHQQIIHNSQPAAAFKRKTLQKDEFVLTIPPHSIMDKQLFFLLPQFSRGKKIFHSAHIQRELLHFGHFGDTKAIPKTFLCYCWHWRHHLKLKKKKKKKEGKKKRNSTLTEERLSFSGTLNTLSAHQPTRWKRACDLIQQALFPPLSRFTSH